MEREVDDLGPQIQMLRKRCGLSIRRLAELAGVTPGLISLIERQKCSPSLGTLRKILTALGTDLGTFFGTEQADQHGPVFAREKMQAVSDGERRYTVVLSPRNGVQAQMMDEQMFPARKHPPFEKLECDVGGYIIAGTLAMEIAGQAVQTLRPGDAFYIPRGTEHRGYATGEEPVRVITVYYPGRY
ncbi:MAG: helix-turn-helix domain-containing protein [Phycisphaerae bacterium]|nr:helix-turn-helix domain-containing protein [Phycisphaerae bacterium]